MCVCVCVCIFCVNKNVAVNTTKVFLGAVGGGGGGEGWQKLAKFPGKKIKLPYLDHIFPYVQNPNLAKSSSG
jgi:hypothetical protein